MSSSSNPLIQAYILLEEAAQEGFDWETAFEAARKVEEELGEVREELQKSDSPLRQQALKEEMGDLFLACICLARHCNVKPDESITLGLDKFKKRYLRLKSCVNENGLSLQEVSAKELSLLWKKLKQKKDITG
jgi:uncharacterized protein YabN with tetrapyrrole methylase and pyrophosphatase domain